MTVVVGLDLSLTATGVARTGAVRNGTFTVKSKGKKTDTLIERADRLADIVDDISLLIPHGAVIVIETPAYNQTGGSHHDRSGLWWLVVDKLIDMNHDHQFHEVSTTQVKKYATGKGNASKMEVMAAAIKRYPEFDIANDNEADALILAMIGRRMLGIATDTVPQVNLTAVPSHGGTAP